MKRSSNVQVINDRNGRPAFVVIPYDEYVSSETDELLPHEVVSRMVDGANIIKAWREHLGLTQDEVARRLGISQSAYAQQETAGKPRKATREKLAPVFKIDPSMLNF